VFGILRSSDSFTVVLFRFLRIELVSIVFILMFADSFYIVLIRFYQLNRGISTRIVFSNRPDLDQIVSDESKF